MSVENITVQPNLISRVIIRLVLAFVVLGAVFFLSAGTTSYWEAWVYLTVLLVPALGMSIYLLQHSPELLERRLKTGEKEAEQKTIIKLASLLFILVLVLPGLDQRFGWSTVSTSVVFIADILAVMGYGVVSLVFRENQFASRTIQVESNQKVISTGPYALVRHPMYLGVLVLYLATPLALGSLWGLIPAILLVAVLAARILNEEKFLLKELDGYDLYTEKVNRRLIPYVW